jgi:hypothetical protein
MVKTANKNKQPYRLINKIKKRKNENNNSFKEERIKKKIMEIVYFVSYQIAKF